MSQQSKSKNTTQNAQPKATQNQVDKTIILPDTNDKKYILYGILVIVAMFGIIGGWAGTAKLDSGVPLSGQVIVMGNNKIIQSEEGGTVEAIYVKNGDAVKKGQSLLKLDRTKLQSNLTYLKTEQLKNIALKARLEAENLQKKNISFPNTINQLPTEQKQKLIDTQQSLFQNDIKSLQHQRDVANQQIRILKNKIDNLKEKIASQNDLLTSYQQEAQEQQELYDAHLTDISKLRELRRKIETIKSEIQNAQAEIRSSETEINKTKTKLQLDEEQFYKKIKEQLVQVNSKLSEIQSKLTTIEHQLSHHIIRSPIDGTVLNLKVHTVGAVIKPAEPILEIVPDNSKLIIKAELDPQYIDYVQPGLKADLRFPSFQLKDAYLPSIEGKVIYVSADSTTNKDGRSFYIVKLIVDQEGKKTLAENNLKLMAGMPASVIIKVGKQTVLEYMLRPIIEMVDKAFLET